MATACLTYRRLTRCRRHRNWRRATLRHPGRLDGRRHADLRRSGAAVVLDSSIAVYDQELGALNNGDGNYSGASVTIARHTAATVKTILASA